MRELQILTNPIRSTLFGKFYEEIFRGWFKTKGFTVYEGKPRVYWKDQPIPSNREPSELKSKLVDLLKRYKMEKQFCTPDGLLEKDSRYFIWEAKNWPLWPIGKMEDVLRRAPWLLTKVATYRKKKYNIKGIIFSWWSKPENADKIINDVRECISPNTFDVYYTKEILQECIDTLPDWYVKIIESHKQDIDDFFRQLLGKSP